MPRKPTSIPQCKRCQDYGHSANYCTRTPRCVKCGQKHLVNECKLPKTSPPRCANCKEGHTANYKGCSYYKSKSQPVKKPRTAVERLSEPQVAPTQFQVGNQTSTYAGKVAKGSTSKKPQLANQKPEVSDSAKILEIRTRLEVAQNAANEKILSIEKRILELENSRFDSPNPPRKHQKK